MAFWDFNKQDKKEKEMQKRQENFVRENTLLQTAAHPSDDQILFEQSREREDLVKWQQNLDDQLVKLVMTLRNYYYDEEENAWMPKREIVGYKTGEDGKTYAETRIMQPLINEKGIHMIESEIYPLLSRNMINTNLNEDRILIILKDTTNTIIANLGNKYDEYDAEFSNFSHIIRLIKNFIIPTPFRAMNDGERKHHRSFMKRIESHSESGDIKQKKGILGF